jgi:two-component system response regulator
MIKQFILLIEDDPNDQELIVRALRQSGIDSEITVTRDGAEALEFLFVTGRHAGRNLMLMPALVLLDLSLPRVSGLEVLRRMRADRLTGHLPVVVVTGAWNSEQILAGFRLQADGFVCKSTDFEKLSEALGKLALDLLRGDNDRASQRGLGQPGNRTNSVASLMLKFDSPTTRMKDRRHISQVFAGGR